MIPTGKSPSRSQAEQEEMRIGWRMAGIGMTVASEVAAGVILGLAFDWWRGHGNTGVVVGSIAGIAVAMWSLLRGTLKLNKQLERTAPTAGRGKAIPFKKTTPSQTAETERDDWNDSDNSDDWDQPRPAA